MLLALHTLMAVLLLAAFYFQTKMEEKRLSVRVLIFMVILFLIADLMVFPLFLWDGGKYFFLFLVSPMPMLFAPMVYFYFLAEFTKEIEFKEVLAHLLPVLVVFGMYLTFVVNPTFQTMAESWFQAFMYACFGTSLLGYALYSWRKFRKIPRDYYLIFNYSFWFCGIIGILNLFLSGLIFWTSSLPEDWVDEKGLVISILLCAGVFILFSEAFRKFQRQYLPSYGTAYQKNQEIKTKREYVQNQHFDKDNFSEQELLKYKNMEKFFSSKAICNAELDLTEAASILSVSQKNLKDMIQERYHTTFSKLLTRKRVDYACRILRSSHFDENYQLLSQSCGFKSKATFYRNFQRFKGDSPSLYRKEIMD